MKLGSENISNGIKVKVLPEFVENSGIDNGINYFKYTIEIENVSRKWAKLIARKWIIIDADGNTEIVEGEGVVGYYPELATNQSFTYSSFCPIKTEWGTMEGIYYFIDELSQAFEVNVARFYLAK